LLNKVQYQLLELQNLTDKRSTEKLKEFLGARTKAKREREAKPYGITQEAIGGYGICALAHHSDRH